VRHVDNVVSHQPLTSTYKQAMGYMLFGMQWLPPVVRELASATQLAEHLLGKAFISPSSVPLWPLDAVSLQLDWSLGNPDYLPKASRSNLLGCLPFEAPSAITPETTASTDAEYDLVGHISTRSKPKRSLPRRRKLELPIRTVELSARKPGEHPAS
jgi:hypothetical protein